MSGGHGHVPRRRHEPLHSGGGAAERLVAVGLEDGGGLDDWAVLWSRRVGRLGHLQGGSLGLLRSQNTDRRRESPNDAGCITSYIIY